MKYDTLIVYGSGIFGSSFANVFVVFDGGQPQYVMFQLLIGMMLCHIGFTGGLKE